MTVARRFRRPIGMLVAVVVVGTFAFSACGQTDNDTKSATAGLPDLAQSLQAHDWIYDPSDSSIALPDSSGEVRLRFDDDMRAGGSGPCNSFSAATKLSGIDGIRFKDLTSTLMGCSEPVMNAEAAYFGALGNVTTLDVTDRNRLVLTGGGQRLAYKGIEPSAARVPKGGSGTKSSPESSRSTN